MELGIVFRCDDCSVDLGIVQVELVRVHTQSDFVKGWMEVVGGVSDGCQMWRFFTWTWYGWS